MTFSSPSDSTPSVGQTFSDEAGSKYQIVAVDGEEILAIPYGKFPKLVHRFESKQVVDRLE
jgi:hypothetical protein